MKIHQVSKVDDPQSRVCDECGETKFYKQAMFVIYPSVWNHNAPVFCIDCLKALRSKIDRLSILVTTGIDTSEE